MPTLSAFDPAQRDRAHVYLATHVAEMMGRKFEEGDWAKVYTAAKDIPPGAWSNLEIDISHGPLGVEQKMICRPAHKSILDSCGTAIMHPAGTRAIRIPREEDATTAAREILRQYAALVDERTAIIEVVHRYNHGRLQRSEAIDALVARARMTRAGAAKALPATLNPIGDADALPDMRMGWLLWASDLREFLYFEEPMTKPDPADFVAEWKASGGGRRRPSRNLWVYHRKTRRKLYSITTDAGAKLQPYFYVPLPGDPNLYHFVVQGEEVGRGLVRVWLTKATAAQLERLLGSLSPDALADAVDRADLTELSNGEAPHAFAVKAIPLELPVATYAKLADTLRGVSDEHTFRLLIDLLSTRRTKG